MLAPTNSAPSLLPALFILVLWDLGICVGTAYPRGSWVWVSVGMGKGMAIMYPYPYPYPYLLVGLVVVPMGMLYTC